MNKDMSKNEFIFYCAAKGISDIMGSKLILTNPTDRILFLKDQKIRKIISLDADSLHFVWEDLDSEASWPYYEIVSFFSANGVKLYE